MNGLKPERAGGRTPVVGIVGGLGSGKSTLARLLGEKGAAVVDADKIGHAVLEVPEVKRRLREAFGPGVFDRQGRVDRPSLAAVVFREPEALQRLNRIVHPPLLERLAAQVRAAVEDGAPMVVIDAALLVEWGLHRDLCDAVVFVDAPEQVRKERVLQSRGWDEEEFRRRAAAQLPLEAKRAAAGFVVANGGTLDSLRSQAEELWERLTKSEIYRTGQKHAIP